MVRSSLSHKEKFCCKSLNPNRFRVGFQFRQGHVRDVLMDEEQHTTTMKVSVLPEYATRFREQFRNFEVTIELSIFVSGPGIWLSFRRLISIQFWYSHSFPYTRNTVFLLLFFFFFFFLFLLNHLSNFIWLYFLITLISLNFRLSFYSYTGAL